MVPRGHQFITRVYWDQTNQSMDSRLWETNFSFPVRKTDKNREVQNGPCFVRWHLAKLKQMGWIAAEIIIKMHIYLHVNMCVQIPHFCLRRGPSFDEILVMVNTPCTLAFICLWCYSICSVGHVLLRRLCVLQSPWQIPLLLTRIWAPSPQCPPLKSRFFSLQSDS